MIRNVCVALLVSSLNLSIVGVIPALAAPMPDCSAPRTIEEGDLCEQAHAVAAAEALNRETALGILVSAIGTIALVVTVYYSSKATRAAVEASQAAKLAIDHSKESSVRELRPYLAIFQTVGIYVEKSDTPLVDEWYFRLIWRNEGKTPATNIRARTNCCIVEGPLPQDFDFPDRDVNPVVGTYGPSGSFRSHTSSLFLNELRAVARGEKSLHVWGWVEYEGFQAGARYRNEFHAELGLWGADPSSREMRIDWNLRDRFNGMDNTCFRPPATPTAARLSHT